MHPPRAFSIHEKYWNKEKFITFNNMAFILVIMEEVQRLRSHIPRNPKILKLDHPYLLGRVAAHNGG